MNKKLAAFAAVLLLATAPLVRGQVGVPNTLVAGATIRATDLNTNFSVLGNHALDRLSGGTIEGNITVDAGVTIDGIDIGATVCTGCAPTFSGANLTSLNGSSIASGTVSSAYGGVPAGLIAFSVDTSCPSGWTEYTTARGRYIVGLVSGGTTGATVGTSLSNSEDRPVGQHTHVQNAHTHGQTRSTAGGGSTTDFEMSSVRNTTYAASASTTQSTVAVNQNAGSVAGTNAPYVQLIACQKS